MNPFSFGHRHSIGMTRREALQVGYAGLLGISWSALPGGAPAKAAIRSVGRTPKSVILVYLTGAPSHIDTFDMKPDLPAEIRGEFRPIATRVPGLQICEHMPRLAARADKYAIVRSLSHREGAHLAATHYVLTGSPQPAVFPDKPASRTDCPCYAAGLSGARPRTDGIPSGVHLPTFLRDTGLIWPGQNAGFLGSRLDPWQFTRDDPNTPDSHLDDNLRLDASVNIERLENRRSLLAQVDRQQGSLAHAAEGRRLTDKQREAFSVLTSARMAHAFDLDREPLAVRERYGQHAFGRSLLLARRLVEAGVPVVQANMGPAQAWDNHDRIFHYLKNKLLPPLDQALSALLDDLGATGLIDETLVLVLGEFGRTPKLSTPSFAKAGEVGRDHWPRCFFGLFAGAGVLGGQVIGKSDRIGADPITTPYSPDDVGATVYHVLGVHPGSEIQDRQGRPVPLNRGRVIESLFRGSGG
jgi:hypothetical protein